MCSTGLVVSTSMTLPSMIFRRRKLPVTGAQESHSVSSMRNVRQGQRQLGIFYITHVPRP